MFDPSRYTRQCWWQRRRLELGLRRARAAIATELGLCERSILRYESHPKPPKWYELALVGLALQRDPDLLGDVGRLRIRGGPDRERSQGPKKLRPAAKRTRGPRDRTHHLVGQTQGPETPTSPHTGRSPEVRP